MTPIESDLKLFPRQLFQTGELAFMKVAFPFSDKHLIALPEAKGAGRVGERGASIAAGKIIRRLHQRRRRKATQAAKTMSGKDRKILPGLDKRERLDCIGIDECIMWFKVLLPVLVPQTPGETLRQQAVPN
jgi:hypothetical protein